MSPDGKALSAVIETMDAKQPQELTFQLSGGLSAKRLHLWQSNAQEQFLCQPDLLVNESAFSITAAPNSIYSITTTEGQQKGLTEIPAATPLPLPYSEDFASYPAGRTPAFLSDFYGVFETGTAPDGQECLMQTMLAPGIHWAGDPEPATIVGDGSWSDYEVACDVFLDFKTHAKIYGRIGSVPHGKGLPKGYSLQVDASGAWKLEIPGKQLLTGQTEFTAGKWCQIGLRMVGSQVTALIGGKEVGTTKDTTFKNGFVGLGCGYERVRFDNLTVNAASPAPLPPAVPQ